MHRRIQIEMVARCVQARQARCRTVSSLLFSAASQRFPFLTATFPLADGFLGGSSILFKFIGVRHIGVYHILEARFKSASLPFARWHPSRLHLQVGHIQGTKER